MPWVNAPGTFVPGTYTTTKKKPTSKTKYLKKSQLSMKKKVKTNKQLTTAVNTLWKGKLIKAHYVEDTATTSVGAPSVTEICGIGQGEDSNQHSGNKIQLRGFDLHGRVRVVYTGGVPSISKATRWNITIVSSILDVGIAGVPAYSHLYDDANLPASMAIFDAFRLLNVESLTKVNILKTLTFTLAPQGQDSASDINSTYPDYIYFKIHIKLGNAKITFREGTAVPLNRNYYIMITTNSTGAVGNLGLEHAYTSKLSFRDTN